MLGGDEIPGAGVRQQPMVWSKTLQILLAQPGLILGFELLLVKALSGFLCFDDRVGPCF